MLWLGCLRTTTVVGTHGLDRFLDERKMLHETQVSTARSPATKSPFLLMTNQNTTSPALHHQNQPPDSGSVHESQRRQLRLSLHRSHRNTCCVCFCFRVFYNFRGEKRRSLYCSSSSHQKSVSADDNSKHNKPSPSSPEPTS